MKKRILLSLLMMCTVLSVCAQIFPTTYTVTGGSKRTGDESCAKLFDGDVHTKWCEYCSSTIYVEFESKWSFIPTGYILTTGSDNAVNNYRNPQRWRLYGRLSEYDEWTELAYVSKDESMEDKNLTPYEFSLNNPYQRYYQYFKFEIYDVRSYYPDYCQLSEFQFKGYVLNDISSSIVEGIQPIYDYTGGNIQLDYTVKDALGNTIDPSYYSTSLIPSANVCAETPYRLTISAEELPYAGYKDVYFRVMRQLTGAGTQSSPYLIGSDADWDLFAGRVREGDTYAGKYVKLTSDIHVTTMAGTSEVKSFRGTFDGDNHSIELDLTATEDACAPFRYLKDAQILNLNITGNVTSGYRYAASLAAYGYGTCVITDCGSTATITSTRGSLSKDFHGGFIGVYYPHMSLTFTNCVFAGKMLGDRSYAVGGFVGYSFASVYYNHCLYAGTEFSMNDRDSYTFNGNSDYSVFRGAYITEGIDWWYGTKVYSDGSTIGKLEFDYAGTKYCTRAAVKIEGINQSYNPTGSVIPIEPKVYYDNMLLKQDTDYVLTTTPSPVQEPRGYTATIEGINDYAGTERRSFVVTTPITGDGTEGNPYLIENSAKWECFATNLNEGMTDYTGKYVKLSDQFDCSASPVTISAGNSQHPFKGIFLGNNRTLTVNISGSDKNQAPFGYIENATIRDLTVAGTISCSLEGDGTNGGFAGINNGNSSFSNCAFTGSLLGELATSNGGFVGWTNGNLTYTDCVFSPADITMSSNNSATFNRNGKNSLTRCYYTVPFGEVQGVCVTYDANTVHTSDQIQIGGVNYYKACDITGIQRGYTYTGSPIAVTPVVTFNDQTLTENTDYTVCYLDAQSQPVAAGSISEVGSYSVVITGMGNYAGSYTAPFCILEGTALLDYVFQKSADEEGEYFIIASEADYNALAAFTDSIAGGTIGQRFKLMNDISVSRMIGKNDDNKSFQGIFDGNGKTLTVSLSGGEYEKFLAPFRFLKNATIRNLTVAGTITSAIWGDGTHGGFAGTNHGETTFENCVFSGSLLAADIWSHPYSCGGFVGWNAGTIHYIDCLFAPARITMDDIDCATFNRNENCDFVRTYFVTPFGDKQGRQVYTSELEYVYCRAVTAADGNIYYVALCYTIGSSGEWDEFAEQYNSGQTAILPVVLLDTFTVRHSIGTIDRPFSGTVYGNGKTLTAALSGENGDYAPFNYTYDVTFHNLTVVGSIDAPQNNGNAYGGFVSFSMGNTYFDRCKFAGSLTGGPVKACAGFVGWSRGNLSFTDCLYASEQSTMTGIYKSTFGCDDYSDYVRAYYLTPFGDEQGYRAYTALEDVPDTVYCVTETLFDGNTYYVENGIKIDTGIPADRPGHYYIVLTAYESGSYTLPADVKTLKVFDCGGRDGSSDYNDVLVTFAAPDGCQLQMEGTLTTQFCTGSITAYDGASYRAPELSYWNCDQNGQTDIGPVHSSHEAITLYFYEYCRFNNCATHLELTFTPVDMNLAHDSSNDSVIAANLGKTVNVRLAERTLDVNEWNTLCVPFDISAEQLADGLLPGAALMELDLEPGAYTHVTGYENGILYLNFKAATGVEAGKPYLIRWENQTEHDVLSDPIFANVTVSATAPAEVTSTDGYVSFVGTFSPVDIYTEDKTNLYLGDGETLYYPWSYSMKQFIVNSCRGYFRLNNGLTAGELPSVQAPLRIEMNIGAQHTTTDLGGDNTSFSQPSSVARKVLSNGQLFILLPDGTRYDATGKKVE